MRLLVLKVGITQIDRVVYHYRLQISKSNLRSTHFIKMREIEA